MKMKISVLVFAFSRLLLSGLSAHAQVPSWLWADGSGSNATDFSNDIVTDSLGNSYITGNFQGTATFGGSIILNAYGTQDFYIAKYNSSGSLLWVRQGGASGNSAVGNSISIDGAGNIYVLGEFYNSITFYSSSGNVSLTGYGNRDIFIIKYRPNGNIIWAKKAGGTSSDGAGAIKCHPQYGFFAITGSFKGTANIAGQTATASGSDADAYIAKYDSSGNGIWLKTGGPAIANQDAMGNGTYVDDNGNIYVVGWFEGSAIFDAATITSSGLSDAFLAKYNSSGILQWINKGGGAFTDEGNDIAVDNSGNVFCTGSFTNSANFDFVTLTSYGVKDIFLAKYNSSGSLFWARKAGGVNDDIATNLVLDDSSNCYITGDYDDQATFGSVTLNAYSATKDIFAAKYSESGSIQWAISAGGDQSFNLDIGTGISMDGERNIYITGYFDAWTAYFGTDSIVNNDQINTGSEDIFIAKILNACNVTTNAGSDVTICNGQSANLSASGGVSYSWTPAGSLSNPNISNPVATPTVTTTYTVMATDANGCDDTDNIIVAVTDIADANFTFSGDPSVTFINTSAGATSYFWDFGDGNTSATTNPVHAYTSNGTFDVMLVAINSPCPNDTIIKQVIISGIVGLENSAKNSDAYFNVIPNPVFANEFTILFSLPKEASVSFSLCNILGEEMIFLPKNIYLAGKHTVSLSTAGKNIPNGIYILKIQMNEKSDYRKIIFQN